MVLSCRIAMGQTCTAAASGPTFGIYNPYAASPSGITGTVSVTCSALFGLSLNYSIRLDGGASGAVASRAMAGGASRLGYQLYTNAAHSVIWGDGTGGSVTVSDGYSLAALGSVTKNYTIYGLIPAGQTVAVGGYLDTVTILITY